jgi:hypothetical protein
MEIVAGNAMIILAPAPVLASNPWRPNLLKRRSFFMEKIEKYCTFGKIDI